MLRMPDGGVEGAGLWNTRDPSQPGLLTLCGLVGQGAMAEFTSQVTQRSGAGNGSVWTLV